MTRHYSDLGSAFDWLNQIFHAARRIRSTTQIWVVMRHQYGISAPVSQTSFGGETKCRLWKEKRHLSARAMARAVQLHRHDVYVLSYYTVLLVLKSG